MNVGEYTDVSHGEHGVFRTESTEYKEGSHEVLFAALCSMPSALCIFHVAGFLQVGLTSSGFEGKGGSGLNKSGSEALRLGPEIIF